MGVNTIDEKLKYMEFLRSKEILTAEEASFILDKNIQTIYSWAKYAGLPGNKINGRTWVFRFSEIINWKPEEV